MTSTPEGRFRTSTSAYAPSNGPAGDVSGGDGHGEAFVSSGSSACKPAAVIYDPGKLYTWMQK